MKYATFFLPLFAAGILAAQPPAAPQAHADRTHQTAARTHQTMVQRLSAKLNLTADQQNQAKSIFGAAREQAKALTPQLRDEHMTLKNAIRSDNETQIDQVFQKDAQVNAQARAIHAKAMAKFYSILSPDQKAKFDQMSARRHRPAQRNA